MKKILLATTAVVALSTVSAQAFAADKIKLELGGFMRQQLAVTNSDEVAPASAAIPRAVNLQQKANNEIYFRGNTTLDNGINVAVDFQKEASNRTTTGYDVSKVTLSSDAMGALSVGHAAHASDDFAIGAPLASSLNWTDTNEFVGTAATAAATTTGYEDATATDGVDIADFGGNGLKLVYVSPSFSGINAFASYSAGTNTDTNLTIGAGTSINNSNAHDSYSYGIGYAGEVAGASISADLMHMQVATTHETNHFGLNVGIAGFTVGGSYADYNDTQEGLPSTTTTNNNADGHAYDFGVGYETGPYSVAVAYARIATKGDSAVAGDNEDTKWRVSGAYDLGAGVALTATYFDSKANSETAGTADVNVNGVIAGLEIGF